MKILVVSDSHMRFQKLLNIHELEKPDQVICAGDHSKDGEELSFVYPDTKFYIVRGNCDIFDRKYNDEMILELEGHKVLLAHGHEYGVKYDYGSIRERAKVLGCDIVVFGHTHIQYLDTEDGITLFNPGAVRDGEYGILYIDKNGFEFQHRCL